MWVCYMACNDVMKSKRVQGERECYMTCNDVMKSKRVQGERCYDGRYFQEQ